MMPRALEILQLVYDLEKKRNDFQKTWHSTSQVCCEPEMLIHVMHFEEGKWNEWVLVLLVLIIANMSSNILK